MEFLCNKFQHIQANVLKICLFALHFGKYLLNKTTLQENKNYIKMNKNFTFNV